jgi:hypothetical protein
MSGADLPLTLSSFNTRFQSIEDYFLALVAAGGGQRTFDAEAGEGLGDRAPAYLDLSDGKIYQMDADAAGPKAGTIRGFVDGTTTTGNTATLVIGGEMDGFTGLTALQVVYVGTTAGTITQSRPNPSLAGSQVMIAPMGLAIATDTVIVAPNKIQYQKRNAFSDDDTLSIQHHADTNGYLRNVWAYVTESEAGAEAEGYSSSNQDSDVELQVALSVRDKFTSWWDLDEASGTRADAHGSNNLTDNNTVVSATGKKGNAADFTRANSEYLSVADNSTLDAGDIDLTLGCWVKLDSKPASMGIMGKWDGDTEYILYYNTSSDRFQFIVNDGSGTTLVNADTLGSPSTGTWYFIMAWHDEANDTINIQVNNGGVDSEAHSTGIKVGTATFALGRFSASNYFDGQMDSPFLAKDLFTSDEKTWLYNGGAGRSYEETNGNKEKLSQTFTLASETDIASVGLWLKKVGSPTGTVTVRIETTSAGEPTGTLADVDATAAFLESTLGTSYAEQLVTFNSEFTLSAGTYAIVLSTSRSSEINNYIAWGADGSSPSYSGGAMFYEQSSSWNAESKDAVFSVNEAGVTHPSKVGVDWWSSTYADVVNRYGDGSGANLSTQTTFKCLRDAGFSDLTVVVEIP